MRDASADLESASAARRRADSASASAAEASAAASAERRGRGRGRGRGRRRAAVHHRGGLRGRAARDECGAAEGRHGERAAEEQVAAGKRGGLRQVVIAGDRGRRLGTRTGGGVGAGTGTGSATFAFAFVRSIARGYARWSRRGRGEHGGGWARARRSFPAKRSEGEHFSVSRRARWDATGRTRNAVAATAATAVSWTPTESTRSCSRCSAAARTRTHRRPRAGAPWPASLFETEARLDILCPIQVVRLVRLASSALTACGRIARDIIASEVEGATRCVGVSRRRGMQCRDATRPYARRWGARRVGVFVHLSDIFSETRQNPPAFRVPRRSNGYQDSESFGAGNNETPRSLPWRGVRRGACCARRPSGREGRSPRGVAVCVSTRSASPTTAAGRARARPARCESLRVEDSHGLGVTRRLAPSHQPLLSDFRDIPLPSSPPALPSPGNRVPRAASSCASSFPRTPRAPPPSPRDASATAARSTTSSSRTTPRRPSRPVTSAPASSTSTPRASSSSPRAARSSTSPPSPTRPPRARPSSSSASDATASSAPKPPRDARSAARNVPSKSHGASPSNLSSLVSLSRPSRARWRRSRHTRCGAERRSCGPSTPRGRTRTSPRFGNASR